jgi:hypothetical protein
MGPLHENLHMFVCAEVTSWESPAIQAHMQPHRESLTLTLLVLLSKVRHARIVAPCIHVLTCFLTFLVQNCS